MNLQNEDNGGAKKDGDIPITEENKEDWEDEDDDNGRDTTEDN